MHSNMSYEGKGYLFAALFNRRPEYNHFQNPPQPEYQNVVSLLLTGKVKL